MYIIVILTIVLIFLVLAVILHPSEPSDEECNKIINTYNSHPTLRFFITLKEFLEWLQFFNNVHDIDYWLIADLIVERLTEECIKEQEKKEKEYRKIIERII